MSHISELYKKIEELQKQMDEMKIQNEKFQDLVDAAGGVLDADNLPSTDDSKKNDTPGKTPQSSNGAGCGAKLNYKEQVILKSIVSQLKVKRIPIHYILCHIDKRLKRDHHFAHEIMREKI